MKLSKHIHSCLLAEDQGQATLFDPGNFSYDAKALEINKLNRLDYILITHEHPDHCYPPFIKELLTKFPDAQIITNPSVVKTLQKENLTSHTSLTTHISFESAPHEKIWGVQAPENVSITLFNKLTHPGDSLQITKTADILALPLTAPWGSTTDAVELATKLKPKYIIPVHDWLWRDEIRKGMYNRLTEYFTQFGIQFKGIETGEIIDL